MTKEQLAKLGITTDKDTLTDEEVFALLEQKHADMTGELKKSKDIISARNSELADIRRKETEKLSEEERIRLHYEELEKKNAELTRQIALSNKIKSYVSIGYSPELAEKVAIAELEGKDTTKYHQEHINAKIEETKASALAGGPKPNTNGSTKVLTKADFDKMSYSELVKLKEEQPAEYDLLSKE